MGFEPTTKHKTSLYSSLSRTMV